MWQKVKVAQSCPTLCDPMDCVFHGILQARILEQVAVPFSGGSSQPRDRAQVSTVTKTQSVRTKSPGSDWGGKTAGKESGFPL